MVEVFSAQDDHVRTGGWTRAVIQGNTSGAGAGDTAALLPSLPLVWQPGRGEGLSSPPRDPGAGGSCPGGAGAGGGGGRAVGLDLRARSGKRARRLCRGMHKLVLMDSVESESWLGCLCKHSQ